MLSYLIIAQMSKKAPLLFGNTTGRAPVQSLNEPIATAMGVQLSVKREDLLHPVVSGNKWRKLKYNLKEAQEKGYTRLLTFGGAYSNHLYAVAEAAHLLGFEAIGVVRGEEHLPLNSTLSHCVKRGMQLHYMDRSLYRSKAEPGILAGLRNTYGKVYVIPEGGSNALAVKGVAELVTELPANTSVVACASGTGGTLAGIVAGLSGKCQTIGVAALKGGSFLEGEVKSLLGHFGTTDPGNWEILTDYHFGGYARQTKELVAFMTNFQMRHGIPLEHVYTGKLFYGLLDCIKKGVFPKGTHIIALHTGGLREA